MELTITLDDKTDRVALLGPAERHLKLMRQALDVSISARDTVVRLSGEGRSVDLTARLLAEMTEAIHQERPLSIEALMERLKSLTGADDQSTEAWDQAQVLKERSFTAGVGRPSVERGAHRYKTHGEYRRPSTTSSPSSESRSSSPSAIGTVSQMAQASSALLKTASEKGTQEGLDNQDVEAVEYASSMVDRHGQAVQAKSVGQKRYLDVMGQYDLVFCTGPAGTGKTYLAVASAVAMLKRKQVHRLVLVRPAVEAGERLGFLPGDMQEKVSPYLRPLLDAIADMLPHDQMQRLLETGVIEIVPLAFMRGRTLNDAVIILDEAQNTTASQMLMFLTRMGQRSKMIVTGDMSQVDLAESNDSGLVDAVRRLQRVKGVGLATLDREDIVRHVLVQRVIEAYGN